MKYLSLIILSTFSLSLMSQSKLAESPLSKHELGINFNGAGFNFVPELNYRFYKTERKIKSLSFGGHYNQVGYSYSLGFWNERRKYLTKNNRLFFSKGLTGNIGYSSYDYSDFGISELTWSAAAASIGYKIGIGYKVNNKISIMSTINPRVNYFFFQQQPAVLERNYRFSAPMNLGVNYRF